MTPNLHNAASQPSFAGEHRSTARASAARWKSGAGPAVLPLPHAFSETPKVSLQGISLSYKTNGSRLLAIDNIDLKVRAGEFLCIVGPSGCGKSTLLHLIAGLHKPTSGHVLIDDKVVEGTGTDRILIFQELGLFPWLTVGQNVEFGMKMKGLSTAEREEKTRYYLRLVHLSQFKDSYTHQLSGGMRQRVALAKSSIPCGKRSTNLWKSNTEYGHEARGTAGNFLRHIDHPLGTARQTQDLASLHLSNTVGRARSLDGRVQRPQFLDRNRCQYEAHAAGIRYLGRARDGARPGCRQQ